ncbi:MAG: hypothetical protein FRX49_04510 [Trebouxia sp. A1-2]|nr:MAG: hypothetical protein FRX49_04510 [Trebouxia sp. A1-2]
MPCLLVLFGSFLTLTDGTAHLLSNPPALPNQADLAPDLAPVLPCPASNTTQGPVGVGKISLVVPGMDELALSALLCLELSLVEGRAQRKIDQVQQLGTRTPPEQMRQNALRLFPPCPPVHLNPKCISIHLKEPISSLLFLIVFFLFFIFFLAIILFLTIILFFTVDMVRVDEGLASAALRSVILHIGLSLQVAVKGHSKDQDQESEADSCLVGTTTSSSSSESSLPSSSSSELNRSSPTSESEPESDFLLRLLRLPVALACDGGHVAVSSFKWFSCRTWNAGGQTYRIVQ